MNKEKKRIAITGIGPLCSMGADKDSVWKNLLAAKTNIVKEKVSVDGDLWAEYYLHKINNFDLSAFGISKEKLQRIKDWKDGEENIDLNYLIAAVKLALDDSGLEPSAEQNDFSLVLAHENIGLMPFGLKISDIAYDMLIGKTKKDIGKKDFFDAFYRKFIKSGYDVQAFPNLFHVAQVFDVHQYSLFINNACASGLYAIEAASQIINSGLNHAVVVAASDYPDVYKYIWFRDLGIYSDDGLIRPFSKNSNGLVFGDGGIGLVLEEMEHAIERNATIYGEYLGGGFDLEGWKITVPQIGGDSYFRTISSALERSGVKTNDIDFLCPHGVGSQPIDYYESQAITRVFGENPSNLLLSAFKPYVGHNLGSSALLETAILLLCLHNDTALPVLNYDPDPKFKLHFIGNKTEQKLTTVMKTCSAFAGFNAAAVFQKV